MRGEEAGINCGDGGEEGDWFFRVGLLLLVGGEERGGEAVPKGVGIEGEHEFDC